MLWSKVTHQLKGEENPSKDEVAQVRQRWKNLRDSYVKDFKLTTLQKQHNLKLRRRWRYAKQMTFLNPFISSRGPLMRLMEIERKSALEEVDSEASQSGSERSDFVLGDSIVKWIEPYPELIIKNGAIFCTVCLKNINTDNKHKLANHMRTAQHLARKLDLEQGTHHDGSGSNTSQADPDHDLDLDECSAISDSQSPSTLDAQPAATEDDAMLIGNIKEECDDTFEEIVEEMLPVTKEELVDILNPLQPSATIESTNVVGPKEESCSEDVESPTLSEPPPKRSRLENVEINGDTPGSSNKCSKDPTQKFYDKINDHLTQKIQDDRELVGIIDSSGNLDLFFQSMAALAKTLSPLDQILLQKNVADVVFQMKVAQLTKKNMSSGTKSSGTEFK